MKKYVCIFIIVCLLCVNVFAGTSFAYSVPVSVDPIENVITNQAALDRIASVCEDEALDPIVIVYIDYLSNGAILYDCYVFSYDSVIITDFRLNRIYAKQSDYTLLDGFLYSSVNSFLQNMSSSQLPSGNPVSILGSNYLAFGSLGQSNPADIDVFYCSEDWQNFDSVNGVFTEQDYNLDISSVLPDQRYFSIFKDEYRGNEYIGIYCSDAAAYDDFTYFDFYFTDFSGSYIRSVLDDDYFSISDVEGLTYILINPDIVYTGEFTLTGGIYHGTSDFGDFNFTCNIVFHENPIDDTPPSNGDSYNSFYEINYNGNHLDNYMVYNSSLKYSSNGVGSYRIWDDSLILVQPFDFSVIFIPDIVTSFLPIVTFEDFYNSCRDNFDIVVTNLNQAAFDNLYYIGAYNDVATIVNTGNNTSLLQWYMNHQPYSWIIDYSFIDDLPTVDYSYTVCIFVKDSYYFRQTNFLIGDCGNILNQFSERFFKEDGFSDKILDSLFKIWDNEYNFFNSSLPILQRLSYWINDFNAIDWNGLVNNVSAGLTVLNRMSGYLYSINYSIPLLDSRLVDIDSYIASIDSDSGNILTHVLQLDSDIDTTNQLLFSSGGILQSSDTSLALIAADVNSLLSMFDGEDFTIDITLPEFDFTTIVELYGGNLDDFAQWINDLVLTLPEFDFSDFPNFNNDSESLLDNVATFDDDLIGQLGNPYDYSDSGVDYFGWD